VHLQDIGGVDSVNRAVAKHGKDVGLEGGEPGRAVFGVP
jgi:hypothetical protein